MKPLHTLIGRSYTSIGLLFLAVGVQKRWSDYAGWIIKKQPRIHCTLVAFVNVSLYAPRVRFYMWFSGL